MGRTSDARPKILQAGRDLMARRGYTALGVAEICATAGVPKGSFYYFFDSKQALAEAVIEEHWANQGAQWAELLGGDKPPLERLRDLFDATTEVQRTAQKDTGAVTGCLFGNLTLELSTQDSAIRERLQEIFEAQIEMVAAVVELARQNGDIKVTDSREAARSLVAQLEGMVLFAKLLNDPAQLDQMWSHSLALLGA
ncbi:TetR/AcrR family transcriptional regulator [Kribbella sancticallisti]|uniref:TetR/AcrR family transcriptional regulator n=1 Tax=Kribbella sancticallisti TaxID=460087 RepID=A0ABP4PX21_9ACTN